MVGTHADSLIAEAALKGIVGFDVDLAYEAVLKDGTVPPANDNTTE
jgi:putative alpha-1,2-mannosidase